jgi:hypothetical protein
MAEPTPDPWERCLRELARWAAGEARRLAPGQPPFEGAEGRVELTLSLPLHGEQGLAEQAAAARATVRDAVAALIRQRSMIHPGSVVDLRSGLAGLPETAPATAREVFVGFAANGAPRFRDLAQWLLQCQDPRLELLYGRRPRLVIVPSTEEELYAEVLAAFRQAPADWRLHGQVVAGFFEVERRDGTPGALALTLQIQSAASGQGGRRRYALNILGKGPDGESLEHLVDRLGHKRGWEKPWQAAASWAEGALATVERGVGRSGPRNAPADAQAAELDQRLRGILSGLARRLEHDRRDRERRTGHGEERHRQGDRPTPFALSDLRQATPAAVLVDSRNKTLIVLGGRGRAHGWSPAGKLVTSIQYTPESIARKRQREIWRPASPQELQALRAAAAKPGAGDER